MTNEIEEEQGRDLAARGEGELVGAVPVRLAVATRSKRIPRSTLKQYNHVAEQSLDWQRVSIHARWWEVAATIQGTAEGRVYALVGQMAAAGEQLGLALSAAVEVELWRDLRADSSQNIPEQEMAMRAMAEAQSLFVIGVGHALANVAVRALALHQRLGGLLAKRFHREVANPFDPFSADHRDWVSMNGTTARGIRSVARASNSTDVVALVKPIAAIASLPSWKDLIERRGEDFHRWRPQSHGVAGVARRSPWEHEGPTRTLSGGFPTYDEARGLAQQTATLATAGMVAISGAMGCFAERWPEASARLGGPKFVLRNPS